MSVNKRPTEVCADGRKIRIVIADDHLIFRDCLCRLLHLEEDLEVVAQASDGNAVPDALRRYEPDILLLDLNMPGSSGFAILQALQDFKNKTRVIVLTGSEDTDDAVRALKLGSSDVVLKQTATAVLVDSIRRVHAGEIALNSPATAIEIGQVATQTRTPPPIVPALIEPENRHFKLTPRERELVGLVVQGFKNKDIAEKMSISEQTVRNHLHVIFDKLGVTDRLELALCVIDSSIRS